MLPLSVIAWKAYRKDISELTENVLDDTVTDNNTCVIENDVRQIEENNFENFPEPVPINV